MLKKVTIIVCEIYLKEMVFNSILSPQISMQYKN